MYMKKRKNFRWNVGEIRPYECNYFDM